MSQIKASMWWYLDLSLVLMKVVKVSILLSELPLSILAAGIAVHFTQRSVTFLWWECRTWQIAAVKYILHYMLFWTHLHITCMYDYDKQTNKQQQNKKYKKHKKTHYKQIQKPTSKVAIIMFATTRHKTQDVSAIILVYYRCDTSVCVISVYEHKDVTAWKRIPRYWPFLWGDSIGAGPPSKTRKRGAFLLPQASC